jgi:hypothetical protein
MDEGHKFISSQLLRATLVKQRRLFLRLFTCRATTLSQRHTTRWWDDKIVIYVNMWYCIDCWYLLSSYILWFHWKEQISKEYIWRRTRKIKHCRIY